MNNVRYPAALKLYGCDLPWVTNATHLGHQLHQTGTMEFDADIKRAQFIQKKVWKFKRFLALLTLCKYCKW